MKWENAKVRWFDNLSGEGFVRVGNESIYIHYSAIDKNCKSKPFDKNFYWRILFSNQQCKVKVIRDSHFTQISHLKGI
jgi:'Cold-shock' DNA-binding domain